MVMNNLILSHNGMVGRDYQRDNISDFFENITNGITASVISNFTGGGKTLQMAFIALNWLQSGRGKCIVLCDQIDLVHQTAEAFAEFNPSWRIGKEMDKFHCRGDEDIIVASAPSLWSQKSKRIEKIDPSVYTMAMVDEAHKSVSPSWVRVLSYFGVTKDNHIPGNALIGMTATVRRGDNVSLGLVYEDIVGGQDIRYGIHNGWLVDIEVNEIKTGVDISNVRVTSSGEYDEKELDALINTEDRNAQVLKAYMDNVMGEQAVVYCLSVDHAYALAELFISHGISAFCIEANTDKELRQQKLEEFKNGELLILLNFATLTTGFNSTEVINGFFARPVHTQLTYIQMLGRFLRPSWSAFIDMWKTKEERRDAIAMSAKPFARIFDFCDVTSSLSPISVASLFGFPQGVRTEQPKKVFKEIVEPLEELALQHNTDVKSFNTFDVDDIKINLTKKALHFEQLKPTDELKQISKLKWYHVAEDTYQMNLLKGRASVVVTPNDVGKWEVIVHEFESGDVTILNKMSSMAGAIKLADDFVQSHFVDDLLFGNIEAGWRKKGVSKKQYDLMWKLYGYTIRHVKGKYEDTEIPMIAWKNDPTNPLLSGDVSDAIELKFHNKKNHTKPKKNETEKDPLIAKSNRKNKRRNRAT